MGSTFFLKVIPLASLFVSGVLAQSEVAECHAGFEWNRNSLGEDPCTVGSKLDASCRGLVSYTWQPIMNSSQYYSGPDKQRPGDLKCGCNTVTYNIYMACTSCQGGFIYSWGVWIMDCVNINVAQYPSDIPQGTAVPRWAYLDITTSPDQTYNDGAAILTGRDPEETPKPIPTVSSSIVSTPTSGSDSEGGKTNVGAIVGGVVGSVVPLTVLSVMAFLYIRHRRQRQTQQQQAMQYPGILHPYEQHPPSAMHVPPVHSVSFIPHNPSNPSMFSPQNRLSSGTYPIQNARGSHYSGAAEAM